MDDDARTPETRDFAALGLHPRVVAALREQRLAAPLPVQAAAIPAVLGGRDVVVSARTGSGKTLAYLAPLSSLLLSDPSDRGPRVLVLVPTRELCLQVTEVARVLGRKTQLEAFAVYGGVGMDAQARALRRGIAIVVATPGRMRDHLVRKNAKFSHVGAVVLDEADRMLEMGFVEDVRAILGYVPPGRQTLLLSATIDDRIERLAAELLSRPVRIRVAESETRRDLPAGLRHAATVVREPLKRALLVHLHDPRWRGVLVFTKTRFRCAALAEVLRLEGVSADALHSDLSQPERTEALRRFRAGELQALVATDVAERGLDIPGVTHVLNFDFPGTPETYLHRVGRTARVAAEGTAFSFVAPDERWKLRKTAAALGVAIEEEVVEGFDYGARPQGRDPLVEPPARGRRRKEGERTPGGGPGAGRTGKRPARAPTRKEFWDAARKRQRGRGPGGPRGGGHRGPRHA